MKINEAIPTVTKAKSRANFPPVRVPFVCKGWKWETKSTRQPVVDTSSISIALLNGCCRHRLLLLPIVIPSIAQIAELKSTIDGKDDDDDDPCMHFYLLIVLIDHDLKDR
mmetsp:Transcript_14662/g.19138  ORF Transcript_14662/g.19138 Transcript_14662/m.19138 type:complete len:110 (+) Transcript_14662:759-1088(+)